VEERLKGLEDLAKILHEKSNHFEEQANLLEKQAEAAVEERRVVMEGVEACKDACDAAVDEAVKEQMIAREAAMQKQFDKRSKAAVIKVKIEAVSSVSSESTGILTRKISGRKTSS
jgi:hypothetical protein